ncbi:ABC transporter substrate-binding protein [Sulfolobus tengchongensis]|uniref:ABC transporter substrate-binding protein n=1 Tax=Sulfolobus tengchongensis TaxID=207809 RepID=A0AAX4KZE7_9CREN
MWKKDIPLLVAILIILSIGLPFKLAVSQSSSVQPEGSIVVVANPVGTWQDVFNPWNSPTASYDGEWFIYEPLALVNYGTGQIIPWLATNWTWTTGYVTTANGTKIQTLALILYLRHDVYFTDGTPFNATAVWYTIALEQAYPQLGYLANYVANMTIINPYEIEIVFKPGTTHMILYTVLEQFIVDPAQWGKYFPVEQLPNGTYVGLNKTGNPYTWQDPDPIGTGPYMLYSFSPQEIVLVANPHYWMPGEPRIKYLLFPAYASSTQAATDLSLDKIQWAGLSIQDIQQVFVSKNPEYNHYFFQHVTSPGVLYLNDLRWPLSDPILRQAISLAINRTAITYLVYYNYTTPAIALPVATGQLSYFNSTVLQLAQELAPPQGNATAALQLLESNGYKLVNGQLIAPNGTPVPTMTIEAPAGSTAWDAEINLIAQDLKQIGINVQVITPPFTTALNDLLTGNFWMERIYLLSTGPTPIMFFQAFLYNTVNTPGNITPIGNSTTNDVVRLNLSLRLTPNSPPIIKLYQYAMGNYTNLTAYENLLNEIGMFWLKYMPAIVLINGWVNYEYVNSSVAGWVTPQHNYWIGAPWYNPPLPVVLALHLVNQSVPEPWWYYTSQVPQSWYTSNDPFVYQPTTTSTSTTTSTTTTTSTVTSVSTTSTTLTSTTTQVSTSTTTVTQTVTSSSSNMGLYIAIAVVVIIIVIIGVVLALRRR